MSATIQVTFYARSSKATADGAAPIYMRVSFSKGERFETSLKLFVHIKNWVPKPGRIKGNSEDASKMNAVLDSLRLKVFDLQRELIVEGKPVTIQTLRNKWFGVENEKPRMLMEIFEEHNNQMKALINREFSPLTHERYETSKNHTRDFMLWKYNVNDMDIKKIAFEFITDYEFWFKSVRKCDHNTTMKYLSNFKKIINICLKNGWLTRDPFTGFKMTKREIERPYLTEEELTILSEKIFIVQRVGHIRDIFLFCCYTGLAYADVKKLSRNEIGTGIDGEKWIFTHRQKTESATRVPLLPPAQEILDRYKDYPPCQSEGKLLPVLSNQKMNAYLKEISDLCGITKKMTMHTARHTFATTVTLTNGVPIETVGKMLGHKNLKTTQHYAKILDKKVSEDMNVLRGKFQPKEPDKQRTIG